MGEDNSFQLLTFQHIIQQFLRMKEKDERELYLTEKLRNMAYNTKYNLLKFFEEYDKNSFAQPKDQIYILGKKFIADHSNIREVQERIYETFQTTPWLTYRCGFPELPNEVVGSYVSDTGWGCMVRVGQMLFAQVIKYHQKITQKSQILNILTMFSDFDKTQPFSIHKIALLARIQYGLKPGDWYNPSQISFILSQLHQQALAQSMKLKFIIFNSGNLFFDNLSENMLTEKRKCQCDQASNQFICPKCNKTQNSIAVIILSRLGLNSPQKKYLTILQKLMQSPFCQGVIGGKPQKALYFVGKQNQHFIYLDPHYVQQADKDLKFQQQTYFCESFRKCKNTSIDSSIGICFYLRNIDEFNIFYREINQLKDKNYEDFFIFMADETPAYIKTNQIKPIQINTQKQDIFEML